LSVDDKIKSLMCCNSDGRIREDIRVNLSETIPFRGARRIDILLGNRGVQFWVVDEWYWVDEVQTDGTTKRIKKPLLPPGSILSIAAPDLRPLSIYGKIQHLQSFEARERWTNRWSSPNGECLNFDTHSSPLHTLRCTNATALWFPLPDQCPPPANCPAMVLESTLGDIKS
jgi:hypothetical protein